MAQKTFQRINFVTGVVDGTLAYDFDHSNAFSEEVEEPVRLPKRRRLPGIHGRDWVREESEADALSRTGAAEHLSRLTRAAAAVGSMVAIVLLVLVLLAKIQLLGISSRALAYEKQISELEYQHSSLTLQYEQIFNLKDVEEIATGVLGMQEPREDQVFYLSGVSSADKAVIITREETGMFSLGLEDIMSSARSYLEKVISH